MGSTEIRCRGRRTFKNRNHIVLHFCFVLLDFPIIGFPSSRGVVLGYKVLKRNYIEEFLWVRLTGKHRSQRREEYAQRGDHQQHR